MYRLISMLLVTAVAVCCVGCGRPIQSSYAWKDSGQLTKSSARVCVVVDPGFQEYTERVKGGDWKCTYGQIITTNAVRAAAGMFSSAEQATSLEGARMLNAQVIIHLSNISGATQYAIGFAPDINSRVTFTVQVYDAAGTQVAKFKPLGTAHVTWTSKEKSGAVGTAVGGLVGGMLSGGGGDGWYSVFRRAQDEACEKAIEQYCTGLARSVGSHAPQQ